MNYRFVCVILIGILYGIPLSLHAKEIVSRIVNQDGYEFNIYEGITSHAPITFSLVDPTIGGEWSVEILNKKNKFQTIDCLDVDCGDCTLEPKNFDWDEAFRDYNPESNRDYFIFRLSFTDKAGIRDEVCFNWGLLPSKPQLSDVVYTYVYNWEEDMIFPNGDFSLKVSSTDADRYWLHWTYSFLFEPPYYFTSCCSFEAKDNERIGYDADWGEFVNVTAQNQFGYVHSDTICTTEYITDKVVLDRIKNLKETNKVNPIVSKPSFHWDNEMIVLSKQMDIKVSDLAGNLVRTKNDADCLSLKDISKGIYIVIYQDNKNIYSNKIIKK